MCIAKSLPTVREILNADSTTGMVACVTQWTPITGVDIIRVAYSIRGVSGSISVQPVIQYADVRTDRPGQWSTVGGTALVNDGDGFVEVDVSTPTASHFFFRLGLQFTENSGSGHADCRLAVSYKCLGEVVATRTLDLSSASATTRYVPITGPLPAVGITGAKAAFLLTAALGAQYTLAYRTLTDDNEEGGAWSAIGALHNPTSDAYDEWILADTGITLAGKMYYQLGVAFSGGSGDGYGTLTVMAAVRG